MLYDPLQRFNYTIQIDPEGFQMPYENYGDTDLEFMQYRYSRLKSYSKHILSVRCNGQVYGGVAKK